MFPLAPSSSPTHNQHTLVVLANYFPEHFANWGQEAHGEGLTRVWSGIMGYSKDLLPLVGPIPNQENLYISAGFSGHGQSRIFSCARHLATMLLDRQTSSSTASTNKAEWDERTLPRSFAVTEQRLERCRRYPQRDLQAWEFDMGADNSSVVDHIETGHKEEKSAWRMDEKVIEPPETSASQSWSCNLM